MQEITERLARLETKGDLMFANQTEMKKDIKTISNSLPTAVAVTNEANDRSKFNRTLIWSLAGIVVTSLGLTLKVLTA